MKSTLAINGAESVIPNSPSKSIVFIDPALDDYQSLAGGVLPGAEIIILDKNGNGVEQITTKLQTIAAAGGTVDQVHIFSHGNSGSLQLGSATLNSDNLSQYESQLQGWRNALSDEADVVVYGCDVGAGSGSDFVDRLGELTGADIAASTDLTGHGGNWNLEWATGSIEAPLALTPEAMADYGGTLRTITVTNTNDRGPGSLRNAIASAAAGDTIQFASSLANGTITLTSGELFINKNLTIEAGNARQLTISGNNASRVMLTGEYTNVTLKNLIIANGRLSGTTESNEATSAGGGIRTGGTSTLTLENCQVKNNVAGIGGGLYTGFRSRTTVINSLFSGNDGSRAPLGERGGGAIATKSGGTLTIRNSEFTNNTGRFGGAINNLLGSMTIENSRFTRNRATTGVGGAVYVDGANTSGPRSLPGPVGGNIIIRTSVFDTNTAGEAGGAAFLFGYPPDRMLLENSTFINNRAIDQGSAGGGVRQGNADLTVTNCYFGNNTAQSNGGGLWLGESGNATITNTTFSDNRAGYVGGAMLVDRRNSFSTNIASSTFVNNIADAYSGGIGVFRDPVNSPITVRNTIFDRNRANNPHRTRQHTGWELGNGGNNIQFPAKLTPDWARDSNATANITIADPLVGPVQTINGRMYRLPRAGSPALRLRSGAIVARPSSALLPDQEGSATDSSDFFAVGDPFLPTEPLTESEIPIETQPPTESEIPIETQDPTESEIPIETQPPTESEMPIETQPPTETEMPIETQPPTETEMPIETQPPTESEIPIETEPPTETEMPIETQPPTETEMPIETQPPTETEMPIETQPPTETEMPIETETPRETETAALIETPRETETAAVIETPTETETPALIETPRETQAPTPPQTPRETQAPTPPQTPTETETAAVIETPTETETAAVIETPTETETAAVIETPTETPASDDCLLEDLNPPDLASILILSNPGQETLNGANDADLLRGGDINESINGLADNDILFGMGGDDNINGGADNDLLFGNEGSDFIGGDAGDDTICGGKDNDAVFGSEGDDFLRGDLGNDIVAGGDGNDSIYGGKDEDILLGEEGQDYILGNLGNDTINAGNGNDIAFGNEGTDLIFGLFGDDTLDGGQENDSLDGGEGKDLLLGGDGNDVLCGDTDNDTMYGGNGNDIFSGGAGDDFLSGDVGDDTLTGGSGSDLFVLNPSWGWGTDIITDFHKGEDLIGLTSNLSFDQLSISSRNNQTLIMVSDTGQLLAKLNGVTPGILTASDFTQVSI
jgi:parallel beta-helix repeat protein